MPNAHQFHWIRPGYQLVKVGYTSKIQLPLLRLKDDYSGDLETAPYLTSQETPNSRWKLELIIVKEKLSIRAYHYNSEEQANLKQFVFPIKLKLALLNRKGEKIYQQMVVVQTSSNFVDFQSLPIEELIHSNCQEEDGSIQFHLKNYFHVETDLESISQAAVTIDCCQDLSTEFEGLFVSQQDNDVTIQIGEEEFLAHKLILNTRSRFFHQLFQQPTEGRIVLLANVDPQVFRELLRFIYTGRLGVATMENKATGLYNAADDFKLPVLKKECEKFLTRHMSSVNCVELLLHGDPLFPQEHKKKAAEFFWLDPTQVITTEKWKQTWQTDPNKMRAIHEFLFNNM